MMTIMSTSTRTVRMAVRLNVAARARHGQRDGTASQELPRLPGAGSTAAAASRDGGNSIKTLAGHWRTGRRVVCSPDGLATTHVSSAGAVRTIRMIRGAKSKVEVRATKLVSVLAQLCLESLIGGLHAPRALLNLRRLNSGLVRRLLQPAEIHKSARETTRIRALNGDWTTHRFDGRLYSRISLQWLDRRVFWIRKRLVTTAARAESTEECRMSDPSGI